MTKTLIVHGLNGSHAPHWQDWWAQNDTGSLTVDLPTPSRPMPDQWEASLANAILAHRNCVLVGHSLGAVLIVRLLGTSLRRHICAALLVAPAETEGSDRIGHFGRIPESRLTVPTSVVASRNDPWMSFERSQSLARAWGSDLVDAGYSGHINVASGHGPWPQGLALRDALLLRGRSNSSCPTMLEGHAS